MVTACVACLLTLVLSAGWAPTLPDGELGSNPPVGKLRLMLHNTSASL